MGSLNTLELEEARTLCIARDGTNCMICHEPLSEGKTIANIDHIDGNRNNNPRNGKNWQLVHHSCNVLKWHIQKKLGIIDGERPPPFEYSIGVKMELKWVRWMIDQISVNGFVSWDEARYTGALEIDASPETTKRYIKKHVVKSDHPKALFKTRLDQFMDTEIIFTSVAEELIKPTTD